MKIVTKILLSVIVSVSIIMGSVSLLISTRMQTNVEAQIERHLSTNLEFITREIDLIVEDTRRTAEIISRNRAIGKALYLGESRGTNQILNDLVRIYPFLNYVAIVEPGGDIFAVSTQNNDGHKIAGEQLLGLNFMENPALLQDTGLTSKLGKISIESEGVIYGQPGDDPYLEIIGIEPSKSQWFIAPVRLRRNLLGMVVLSYNWRNEMSVMLKETTEHLKNTGNPTIETLLVDKEDQILVADNQSLYGVFESDPSTIWKKEQIIIGNKPMDLIIVEDRASIYGPLIDTRNLLLSFVLVGSVALIVILYFLLRQVLLRRLVILHEGTVQLGGGKLSSRMPRLGDDEIGNLATSFNRMAERMESTTVSRNYVDNIFESVTDGIITIDNKGMIMTHNSSASSIFGYASDEITGQNISILMPPNDRDTHDSYLQKTQLHMPRIIGQNRELRGYRKDGSLFPIDLTVTPLEQDGKHGFVGTIRDITERKNIEQHLEQRTDELKRTNKELERFVYVASHDLKAPMRGIDNLATWIEEDLEGKLEEETQENLTLLRGRVHRMEDLLDGLLEYSRIGRVATKPEKIDTRELVIDIVDLLALPDGFKVEMPDKMPTLATEKVSIQQVFRNLINNAVKHHDLDQGCITITASESNGKYEFSVADDGAGINSEFHERVFTMFQTLKPRDEVEGSGMGLALVKKEVELHDGTVRIDSKSGVRGTTFIFTWKGNSIFLANNKQRLEYS